MSQTLGNDQRFIRSCILYDAIRQKPILESYRDICDVIGSDQLTYYDFQFWFYRFSKGEWDLDYDRSLAPKSLMFTDLTVDVVEEIVDYLEIRDQISLRKVSRNLRSLVARQKPNLWALDFTIEHDDILVKLNPNYYWMVRGDEELSVSYTFPERYTSIIGFRHGRRTEVVNGDDFVQTAIDDVGILLKNPKLQLLYCLYIVLNVTPDMDEETKVEIVENMRKFYEKMGQFMSSLTRKLPVQKLEITAANQDDVMTILPFLEPGTLAQITIKEGGDPMNKDSSRNVSIDKFFELEQWKQLEELVVDDWPLSTPLDNFMHLKYFDILFESITINDLIFLRDNLPNSTNFEACAVRSDKKPEFQEMVDALDLIVSYHDNYTYPFFHYPIPDTEDVLKFGVSMRPNGFSIERDSWDLFQEFPY